MDTCDQLFVSEPFTEGVPVSEAREAPHDAETGVSEPGSDSDVETEPDVVGATATASEPPTTDCHRSLADTRPHESTSSAAVAQGVEGTVSGQPDVGGDRHERRDRVRERAVRGGRHARDLFIGASS